MATLDIPGGQPDLLRHVRRRRRGTWRRSAHRILHDPVTLLAAAILLAIFLAVLFAPYMTAYDPYVGSALRRLRPIGTPGHWLGTDEIGRDIYTRLLFGGRLSLLAGVTPVAFALLIGGSLGLVAGYGGGWVNTVIMRTMDMFYAFPSVLLAVAICSIVGAGLTNTIIALTIVLISPIVRLTQSLPAMCSPTCSARSSSMGQVSLVSLLYWPPA